MTGISLEDAELLPSSVLAADDAQSGLETPDLGSLQRLVKRAGRSLDLGQGLTRSLNQSLVALLDPRVIETCALRAHGSVRLGALNAFGPHLLSIGTQI